jgi:tRNA-dihydrouridine synthase
MRRHFELLEAHFHETPRTAALHMRKHGTWYVRGIHGAAALRTEFMTVGTAADFERILEKLLALGYESGFRDPRVGTRELADLPAESCG